MAPSRHVAEAPRILLPRIAVSRPPARISISFLRSSTEKTRLQQQITSTQLQRRQFHALNTPHHSSRISTSRLPHSISSSLLLSSKSTNTSPSSATEYTTNPIRYNGVYVAAVRSAKRAFHATAVQSRDHHFDTLKFVQRLKDEGFSEEQATAMMRVLNDVIQESIQNLTRTMVLREGKYYWCLPRRRRLC
jgi:hypothetical protein